MVTEVLRGKVTCLSTGQRKIVRYSYFWFFFFAATFSTFVFSSLFVMHPKLQMKPITELGTFEADQSFSQQ